ncbi:MAG TPA: hypothetical protein VFV87_02015 [Pirellulaceae bacterium]|nr:hypothetical protein [Pirellulaceae bacterium]
MKPLYETVNQHMRRVASQSAPFRPELRRSLWPLVVAFVFACGLIVVTGILFGEAAAEIARTYADWIQHLASPLVR